MRRFAVILVAVAAAVVGVGAPTPRQAVADSTARSSDGLAGKFAYVSTRDHYSTLLQNMVVRRVGSHEFLAGEYVLRPDDRKEWQVMECMMIPIDQIDTILVYDSREKAVALRESADKERQATEIIPPQSIPPTGIPEQSRKPSLKSNK